MTKRDFFRVIIKLFGSYSLILSLFTFLPGSISYLSASPDMTGILWLITIIILTCLVYVFLIRKVDKFIDFLKLDKGFDDELMHIGNLSEHKIIMLGSIIVGGFLLIDNIPAFIGYALETFRSEALSETMTPRLGFKWFTSFVNIIIGYLLINNYDWIAKKLIKREE
jgi:hypothetical protein